MAPKRECHEGAVAAAAETRCADTLYMRETSRASSSGIGGSPRHAASEHAIYRPQRANEKPTVYSFRDNC